MDAVARMQDFAGRALGDSEALSTSADFPHHLWRELGRAGLLGLYIPTEYGGLGGDGRTMLSAGEALAGAGGALGLALSWMLHGIVGRFLIAGFANQAQQARCLPAFADGSLTAAVAISEPGVGAHPKLLETRAVPDGADVVIDGEKTWITNGSIADMFLVLAITAVEQGRKRYSVFFVPSETRGLTVTPITSMDFLRPSPHATLRFQGCRVPAANLLGPPGEAYERMARPLRGVEDVLALGPLLGGLRALLRMLARDLAARGAPDVAGVGPVALGTLEVLRTAMSETALRAADELDAAPAAPRAPLLALAAREVARRFQSQVQWVIKEGFVTPGPDFDRLARDIDALLGIPRKIELGKLRSLGEQITKEL